jgi:hypothetical protein
MGANLSLFAPIHSRGQPPALRAGPSLQCLQHELQVPVVDVAIVIDVAAGIVVSQGAQDDE